MGMQQAIRDGDELLDPQAVGATISTPVGTLANWRSAGKGPPFIRISPKKIRYRRSDLERWLQERTHTPRVCA